MRPPDNPLPLRRLGDGGTESHLWLRTRAGTGIRSNPREGTEGAHEIIKLYPYSMLASRGTDRKKKKEKERKGGRRERGREEGEGEREDIGMNEEKNCKKI